MKKLSVPQKLKPFLPWLLVPALCLITWFERGIDAFPFWLHCLQFLAVLVLTAYAVYRNHDELEELVEKAQRRGAALPKW